MIIDINNVVEYIYCPVYYKLKSKGMHTVYTNLYKHYDDSIHTFVNAYNHKLNMDGKINFDNVKSIFSSIWLGTKTKEDFIFIETSNTQRDKQFQREAINSVINFHKFNTKYPYNPITIDYRYNIPITSKLSLTGSIELIRECNGKIEIVDYISRTHFFSAISNFDNNLNAIAMSMAFKSLFSYNVDETTMYYFDKVEEKKVVPTSEDYYKLKQTVINVAKCINNNIIYFQSDDRCKKCTYYTMCRNKSNLKHIFER